jgi:hypothetical protein
VTINKTGADENPPSTYAVETRDVSPRMSESAHSDSTVVPADASAAQSTTKEDVQECRIRVRNFMLKVLHDLADGRMQFKMVIITVFVSSHRPQMDDFLVKSQMLGVMYQLHSPTISKVSMLLVLKLLSKLLRESSSSVAAKFK